MSRGSTDPPNMLAIRPQPEFGQGLATLGQVGTRQRASPCAETRTGNPMGPGWGSHFSENIFRVTGIVGMVRAVRLGEACREMVLPPKDWVPGCALPCPADLLSVLCVLCSSWVEMYLLL